MSSGKDFVEVKKSRKANRQEQKKIEEEAKRNGDKLAARVVRMGQNYNEEGKLGDVVEKSIIDQHRDEQVVLALKESMMSQIEDERRRQMYMGGGDDDYQKAVQQSMLENYGRPHWWQQQEKPMEPTIIEGDEDEEENDPDLKAAILQSKIDAKLIPAPKPNGQPSLAPISEDNAQEDGDDGEAQMLERARLLSLMPQATVTEEELIRQATEASNLEYAKQLERQRLRDVGHAQLRIGDDDMFEDLCDEVLPPSPPRPPAPAPVPAPPTQPTRGATGGAVRQQHARPQQQQQQFAPPQQPQRGASPQKQGGRGKASPVVQPSPPPPPQPQPQQEQPAWLRGLTQHASAAQHKPCSPALPPQQPYSPPRADPFFDASDAVVPAPFYDPSDAVAQRLMAETAAEVQAQPFAGLQGGVGEDTALEWAIKEGGSAEADPDEILRREEEELKRVAHMSRMEAQAEAKKRAAQASRQVLRGGGVWGATDKALVFELKTKDVQALGVLCGAHENQLEHFRMQYKVTLTPRLDGPKKQLELRTVQRQTAMALFEPKTLESVDSTIEIAQMEVLTTLANPDLKRKERLETQVHIFVDWSNIVLGAQPHDRGYRCGLDVAKFAALLQADRALVKGFVSGSNHRFYSQDWPEWDKLNYGKFVEEVSDRRVKKERGVDNSLKYELGRYTSRSYPNMNKHVLVVATGDGNLHDEDGKEDHRLTNFPEVIEQALAVGYRVELWTWRDSASKRFYDMQATYRSHMVIKELDDYREYVSVLPEDIKKRQEAAKAATASPSPASPPQTHHSPRQPISPSTHLRPSKGSPGTARRRQGSPASGPSTARQPPKQPQQKGGGTQGLGGFALPAQQQQSSSSSSTMGSSQAGPMERSWQGGHSSNYQLPPQLPPQQPQLPPQRQPQQPQLPPQQRALSAMPPPPGLTTPQLAVGGNGFYHQGGSYAPQQPAYAQHAQQGYGSVDNGYSHFGGQRYAQHTHTYGYQNVDGFGMPQPAPPHVQAQAATPLTAWRLPAMDPQTAYYPPTNGATQGANGGNAGTDPRSWL